MTAQNGGGSGKADLLLVAVTLLAGVSWIFSKEAVLLMPPLLFMAQRFLLAGLVLALDAAEGAHCKGLALSVEAGHEEQTLAELRERELISSAYVERDLEVELADGRLASAVTYVIDPNHVQYCGGLSLEEQAQMIAHAAGGRGPNTEYLYNTAAHLAEIGLHDRDLDWLAGRVREITA